MILKFIEDCFEVVHDEVQCFGRGVWRADGRHIDDLQRDGTAGEVTSRARLLAADKPEEFSVELLSFLKIPDFDVDPEEARHVGRPTIARLRPARSRLLLCSHVLLHWF